MLVQLNPDVTSYSESMGTLKFAERVAGVELGAARSSKEGKDDRELVDQVQFLCFLLFTLLNNSVYFCCKVINIMYAAKK